MKKHRILRIAVAVLIVLTSTVVMPHEAWAATPHVVSVSPNKGVTFTDQWDGEVTITYDRNIAFGDSGFIEIYQRYYNNGAWRDELGEYFNLANPQHMSDPRISISGKELTIDFDEWMPEAPVGSDYCGDTQNRYGNDYKYIYWVSIDSGAIESVGADPAPAFTRDNFQVFVQATPPEVTDYYPTGSNNNPDGLVLTLTFDEIPYLTFGTNWDSAIIYKYDSNADSWETAPHITCTISDVNHAERQILFTPDEELEPSTLYGVMVSGPANEFGSTDSLISDNLHAVFPGIDYPFMYTDDFRLSGVWYFETGDDVGPLTLDSTSPAAGNTEVPVDSDLSMVFSETVIANDDGGDYYVKIRDYDTDSLVSSIDVDDILPSGSGYKTVTISNSLFNLDKNEEYYVTIDENAFRTTSLKYFSGIGDKSWYFSTTTTHRVRFYDYDNSLLKSQNVDHGSGAVPPPDPARNGYRFDGWDGDYTGVTEDRDLTAQYTKVYKLNYTAGDHGSIQGDANQIVEMFGDGTQVTAAPDAHYHFDEWSDGRKKASRTDKNVIQNVNVTAYFAIDQHTLTYTAGPNGSVTGDTSQTVDYGGDGTTVTAVADTGYHFLRWSDGVTMASRTDTGVTGDITVQAQFEIYRYILTYTAGSHGSIQGANPQTVDHGSDGSAVKAMPDTGYHFIRWSDGLTSATRTDTAVTADIDVTAQFEINIYTVTFADYDGTVLKRQRV